ncbi:MAG TPA: CBS domain-containing protein [Candidatus Limnocylindrales bacterium]|nr:CBS domain-containing protein [Candidatus Limnocylindrales bacterium]
MKISELPPGRLLSVDPDTTIAEVARRMRTEDTDSVAVMSQGRLVGIVTERDMVRAIADGVDSQQATASVVMTADPATVDADEDAAVVAVKMMRLGVRHLPVVNKSGKPIGLVSARNLVAVLDQGAG